MRVYLHLGRNLWGGVIPHLRKSGLWDHVVWDNISIRGGHPDHVESRKRFGPHSYRPLAPGLYEQVHAHLYKFLNMYVRNNAMNQLAYNRKTIHDMLDIFNIQVSYYAARFADENIDTVIFNRSPHTGSDFAAYLVARALGLQTLVLQKNGNFPGRFFHVFDDADFGLFETSRVIAEPEPWSIERKFEKKLEYMERFYARTSMRDRARQLPVYRMLAEIWYWRNYDEAWMHYRQEKQFRRFKRRCTTERVDLEGDFVYFPLHFQPEQNTTAWGGLYDDQLLAIEQLSARLPEGWRILVKENPQQTGYMRGKWFFERLRGIPGATLVPGETDTYELLRKSRFAATVTGTVGWESITGGKPVLVFGPGCWYRTLPGVVMFSESFVVEDIMHCDINHEELEHAVARLLTRCGYGEIYQKFGQKIDGVDPDRNNHAIAESLQRILGDSPPQRQKPGQAPEPSIGHKPGH